MSQFFIAAVSDLMGSEIKMDVHISFKHQPLAEKMNLSAFFPSTPLLCYKLSSQGGLPYLPKMFAFRSKRTEVVVEARSA